MNQSLDLRSLLGPLHLLSYSALLGAQLYQTFVVVRVSYRALPRGPFATLQRRLFPIYFRSQFLLLLLTAVTITPQGPLTLIANKAAWIPFAVAGVTAALNLLIYGPQTRQLMAERIHQSASGSPFLCKRTRELALTRSPLLPLIEPVDIEGKKTGGVDADMQVGLEVQQSQQQQQQQQRHRSFVRAHATSIHLNLLTIGATLWWGWKLASNLNGELSNLA
ncbi:hypothetical protein GGS20DRAFT_581669 [Poronia punctata]|nr:hypothetical protein GGS20DRAFT_581669 [Poronia punctata]